MPVSQYLTPQTETVQDNITDLPTLQQARHVYFVSHKRATPRKVHKSGVKEPGSNQMGVIKVRSVLRVFL